MENNELIEKNKSGDSSLHDWFSKSRSSDGKPGWVQLGGKYAGKPCAKQPGQTTKPKCGSSKMKRNLNKKEEDSAFRRKNRQDPNPDRKGKAINVKTESTEVTMISIDEKAGTKDACYHKVKARYSVWPSAYASGALVKCRKKGAKNWGNKSKKEEFEGLKSFSDFQAECWKTHKKVGMKMKGGKLVNDCRPKNEEFENVDEGVADRAKKVVDHQRKGTHGDDHELDTEMKKTQKSVDKLNKVGERLRADTAAKKLEKKVKSSKNEEAEVYWSSKALDQLDALQKEAYGGKGSSRKARLSSIHPPTAKAAIKNIPDDESDRGSGNKSKRRIAKMSEAKVDKGRSDYGKASIRNYRRMGPGHDDPGMFDPEGKRGKTIEKRREEHKARRGVKGAKVPAYKRESTSFEEAKKCWKGYEKKGTQKLFGKTYNRCVKKEETTNVEEGAAWTRKAGKNKSGGLNEKGRKSYERENPGSDLKAPSKKVGNPRRASFCARMKGMKAKLTSKKTASDPDSRINKSLRAWNC